MKKIILAAVALLCLQGTAAAQRHIEYRWHGIYFVGDASYVTNALTRSSSDQQIVDTVSGFMASLSGGYQFRKEAGVGLGFSYFSDPTGAFTQLPLYVELRSHFSRSRWTPYTVLQVGYTMPVGASSEPPITKIDEGGLYLGIEFGYRYAFNRTVALAGHIGYHFMQSNSVIRHDAITNAPILKDHVVQHLIGGGLSLYLSND
ncbi:MAG: outer membrane beta-barrel protein [Bacteroidales bacterium]|nr:outer membrane beta-barrel protein [Bacteroidales bacterium]